MVQLCRLMGEELFGKKANASKTFFNFINCHEVWHTPNFDEHLRESIWVFFGHLDFSFHLSI